MADRPILFSAPMVTALLDGRKTQTRRALNPAPFIDQMGNFCAPDRKGKIWNWGQNIDGTPCLRNYIKRIRFAVGDRLWVKETHACVGDADRWTLYRASGYEAECDRHGFDKPYPPESEIKWKPSIFMRRALSRLTLTVTDVRVQRLQDCSEADALAEGVIEYEPTMEDPTEFSAFDGTDVFNNAVSAYRDLWNLINGAGAWEANPWVVAVSFDVRKGNIDG